VIVTELEQLADAQSGFCGDISLIIAYGICVSVAEACGWSLKNCSSWFLDRTPAE